MKAQVELTLRHGHFCERVHVVAVPIDDYLARELMEPVEWSDEPFSILLANPGMFGCFVGSVYEFLSKSEKEHDDQTHLEYRLLIEVAHSRITRSIKS